MQHAEPQFPHIPPTLFKHWLSQTLRRTYKPILGIAAFISPQESVADLVKNIGQPCRKIGIFVEAREGELGKHVLA
jgi:hypothetical protein